MDENEATRLCREVWRQLVTSQDRIRRVQGKLRESQMKKLRIPVGNVESSSTRGLGAKHEKISERKSQAPSLEVAQVSREEAEAVKAKLLLAVSVRGIQDVKSLFKHKRFITENELVVLVRSKLRLAEAAVTDEEISSLFRFIDQKSKKKIAVTFICGFLVPESEENGEGPDLDKLEALRWKRMELARDLERFKENIA